MSIVAGHTIVYLIGSQDFTSEQYSHQSTILLNWPPSIASFPSPTSPATTSFTAPPTHRAASSVIITTVHRSTAQPPVSLLTCPNHSCGFRTRISSQLRPSPPPSAVSIPGAVAALRRFFAAPLPRPLDAARVSGKTLVLTGAGLSVASGLPDYRGVNGTYRVNKTYRPIFHHEFLASHEARKRYWARSFLGWSTTHNAAPNVAHYAVRDMGALGLLSAVITQNVDSFHPKAHPQIPTVELHGYLRTVICTSCKSELDRNAFQKELARLNPRWEAFLDEALKTGALSSEDPAQRRRRGIKANPDGDVDLPEAPYTTFRYPPCPKCLEKPQFGSDSHRQIVETDKDGAWAAPSTGGILKPNVVMFGESIAASVKHAAEDAVNASGRLLVMGTSLATYSAWRLVKQAKARGMPIAIINAGGVRGEDQFFADLDPSQQGELGVRTELMTDELLPVLMDELRKDAAHHHHEAAPYVPRQNSNVFKDMLS